MPPPENLEPRVTALEGQVQDLRDEMQTNKLNVAAVQALVVAVDRDVSAMQDFRRATVASFNALRADMVDLRTDVTELRTDVTDLRTDVADLRQDVTDGQQRIVELIQTFIDAQGDNASA
ncbi:hypothetical protein [Mycolicibacter longobardus]|nr:hypothetical protein [Mycolicibacter longobardus]